MTVAEAIKGLKELREWEGLPFCIEEPLGEAGVGVITEEALEMSIRSLEAWDKVTEEICKLHDNDEAYWNGVYDCLKIINRHLKEVKE